MNTLYNITELVSKAKSNNIIAQKNLYDMFSKEMLLLSYRMTRNMEEAQDILQESFIAVFLNINDLKDTSKFKPWLKRIVINNSLKYLNNKDHFESIESIADDVVDNENDEWYKNISIEQISKSILELPNGCRQVFVLYLFEDYKHKEIAEILKIAESTSKSQYRRALKLLQEKLKHICHEQV